MGACASCSKKVIDETQRAKMIGVVEAHADKFFAEYCIVAPTQFEHPDALYYAFDIFMTKNISADWRAFKDTFDPRGFLVQRVRNTGGGCIWGRVFFGISLKQWVV